jgi:hypothetical protein
VENSHIFVGLKGQKKVAADKEENGLKESRLGADWIGWPTNFAFHFPQFPKNLLFRHFHIHSQRTKFEGGDDFIHSFLPKFRIFQFLKRQNIFYINSFIPILDKKNGGKAAFSFKMGKKPRLSAGRSSVIPMSPNHFPFLFFITIKNKYMSSTQSVSIR